MLHFGVAAVLLGREMMVQMPSLFPIFFQVLGRTGAKDPPRLLQPSWARLRMSCCCHGGSLLHVPLSSHLRDMLPLPSKPPGPCSLQGKFPKPVSSASARVSPCGSCDKPTVLELSLKYATLGAVQTSGTCRITGSVLQAGEPLQCCIAAAFIVRKVKLSTLLSRSHWCHVPWYRKETWHREGVPSPCLWEMD